MRVIGFTGGMGVGKSTAIGLMKEIVPKWMGIRNVKFAQPLYDIQEEIYKRISPVYQRPADFVKDRTLLQWLGTNWGRGTISEDIWINLWKQAAMDFDNPAALVVCDDVRFDNEAQAIQDLGGVIVKLERPKPVAHGGLGLVGHASEAGVDPKYLFHTITNKGTKDDFKRDLAYVYDRFATIRQINQIAKGE